MRSCLWVGRDERKLSLSTSSNNVDAFRYLAQLCQPANTLFQPLGQLCVACDNKSEGWKGEFCQKTAAETETNKTKQNQSKVAQQSKVKPNQTKPNQAKPNQAKPNNLKQTEQNKPIPNNPFPISAPLLEAVSAAAAFVAFLADLDGLAAPAAVDSAAALATASAHAVAYLSCEMER